MKETTEHESVSEIELEPLNNNLKQTHHPDNQSLNESDHHELEENTTMEIDEDHVLINSKEDSPGQAIKENPQNVLEGILLHPVTTFSKPTSMRMHPQSLPLMKLLQIWKIM
jgi:hypothetical protein